MKLSTAVLGLISLAITACNSGGSSGGGTVACNTNLSGSYAYTCYQNGGVYNTDTVTTNGTSTFTYTVKTYTDSACTTVGAADTVISGTLTVVGSSSTVSGATEVNLTPTNGGNWGCGVNAAQYTLYKFDDSTCKIQFGTPTGGNTGCASGTRHTAVSATRAFTRTQ